MLIAHLSDLHLLSLEGVPWHAFLNQRVLGGANLLFNRAGRFKRDVARALVTDVRQVGPDHVVVTGDLTNLTLRPELELAAELLGQLGLPPTEVSVVPGNHDAYTLGAALRRDFQRLLAPFISSDIAAEQQAFPYVRLRGEVAIVGLSSARPSAPLFAVGELGARQLEAAGALLRRDELRRRFRLVLLHHPPRSPHAHWHARLKDGQALVRMLSRCGADLLLHGHLHRDCRDRLAGPSGAAIDVIGVNSSVGLHSDPARCASYNLYRIAEGELRQVSRRRYDGERGAFVAA